MDVGVELIGVSGHDRAYVESVFDRVFGARPVSSDHVKLVFGERAANDLLGDRFYEIQAPVKWGAQRKTYRSSWYPYCIPLGRGWVVTAPHPDALRRSGWRNDLGLEAALGHAIHLASGGEPFEPPNPVYRVQDWDA